MGPVASKTKVPQGVRIMEPSLWRLRYKDVRGVRDSAQRPSRGRPPMIRILFFPEVSDIRS